jgi:hypothetical protein
MQINVLRLGTVVGLAGVSNPNRPFPYSIVLESYRTNLETASG